LTAVSAPATSLTDLIRFLIARVDDDDAVLKKEARSRAHGKTVVVEAPGLRSAGRLRAENDAKREVIAAAQQLLVLRDQPSEKPVRDNAGLILKSMAQAYADHPSFRVQWR
jgi:hypothetical protein